MTHVLYPFGVRGDTDDGKCYMRSLERRWVGQCILLHAVNFVLFRPHSGIT